jgi:hypothetical protein
MLQSTPQPAALSARQSGAHVGARVRHAPHRAVPAARDGGVAYADAMKTSRWRKAFELLEEKKVWLAARQRGSCSAAAAAQRAHTC